MGIFLGMRLVAYLAIPLAYWWLDLLHYGPVGKAALLGGLAVLAISAWRVSRADISGAPGWLWEVAVAAPFFFILALEAFLRDHFGVGHDDALVTEALFSSNSDEAAEFILANSRAILKHTGLFAAGLATFGAAVLLTRRYPDQRAAAPASLRSARLRRPGARAALVFGGLFLLVHLNPTMRKADPLLYFPLRYAKWQHDLVLTRDLQLRLAEAQNDPGLVSMSYAGTDRRTVVFVLGESGTRLNWSLYGYPRQTTPRLQEVAHEILAFQDVITGYPGTNGSLKQIFSPATLARPELWATKPDILTVAKKTGYKVFWLSNHSTDRSGPVSIIASHADVTRIVNRGGSRGEGSHDEVLLPELRQALDDPAPRKFIIVHMLGQHPAYNFRYPEEYARFDDADDEVSRKLREEGRAFWAIMQRDQYDNAILYSDQVLREILDMTRAQAMSGPVAWLFAPDHGEDVAHYNNFVGHNSRVRAMYEIPMVFWSTAGFGVERVGQEVLRARPYQLDVLDHTLLGLLAVRGPYYEPAYDILSDRFHPVARTLNGARYP